MGLIAFWTFLAVSAVAVSATAYFTRLESEKTIRQAIEKGVLVDAETIARLRRPAGLAWAQRLIVLAVIALFSAVGVAVFALILAAQEPDSLPPLLAIASFVGCLGVGLSVAGWWLKRPSSGGRDDLG